MDARQCFEEARKLALQMAVPCDGVDIRVTNTALALLVDGLIAQQVEAGIPEEVAEEFFTAALELFRAAGKEA